MLLVVRDILISITTKEKLMDLDYKRLKLLWDLGLNQLYFKKKIDKGAIRCLHTHDLKPGIW